MSDKAETVTCHLCGDTGIVHFEGGDENCAVCHARMVLDTGAGVAPLTVGVAPYPDRYIKPALGHGASGIENVTCGACGRPDRVLTAALADRDATIAEQLAEIERLKQELFHATKQRDKLQARVDRYPADCQWLRDQADHQREKAEKYLAVVKAKDVEIMALGQAWSASMATGQAMQDAGIQFRHLSQDIPPFVAEETE